MRVMRAHNQTQLAMKCRFLKVYLQLKFRMLCNDPPLLQKVPYSLDHLMNEILLFLSAHLASPLLCVVIVRKVWGEDAHLNLSSVSLYFLDIYKRKLWIYATLHPNALDTSSVQYVLSIPQDHYDIGDVPLSLCVLVLLAQGNSSTSKACPEVIVI